MPSHIAVALVPLGLMLSEGGADLQRKGLGVSDDPYEYATTVDVGGSYCLHRTGEESLPIREITNKAAWNTCMDVVIDTHAPRCKLPDHWVDPPLRSMDKMKIEEDKTTGRSFLVIKRDHKEILKRELTFVPSVKHATYLVAKGDEKNRIYDYYIYLYDLPQVFKQIYKYYRIEAFAPGGSDTCPEQRPDKRHVVDQWSYEQMECGPSLPARELGEGDGPERRPKLRSDVSYKPPMPNEPINPNYQCE